jgi:hypothetical protein
VVKAKKGISIMITFMSQPLTAFIRYFNPTLSDLKFIPAVYLSQYMSCAAQTTCLQHMACDARSQHDI